MIEGIQGHADPTRSAQLQGGRMMCTVTVHPGRAVANIIHDGAQTMMAPSSDLPHGAVEVQWGKDSSLEEDDTI